MSSERNKRTAYVEKVGVWWDRKDGSIHLASQDIGGFHIAVNPDPRKRNGHPTLYRALTEVLMRDKKPAPPLNLTEDKVT